jgi:toxin ParE1/3/4
MAEVRWSLTASDDLQDVEHFIARDSILHAINFIDRIVESTGKLERIPELGRVVPEFARTDIRELIFNGYRIVYLLRNDTVTILRVVHGARDLAELVRKEPWEISE